jgi:KRAB domain-containing zinc finger protein
MHTGVKSYECKQCGKAFYSPRGLRTHQQFHCSAKTYVCK